MERRLVIRAWLATAMLVLAAPGVAQDVSTVQVPQAFVALPELDVWVRVEDAGGRPVQDLPDTAFRAWVDGAELEVLEARRVRDLSEPLALVVVVDVSRTMAGTPIQHAREAAAGLVASLEDGDRAAIIGFGDEVEVLSDFTSDPGVLAAAIDELEASADNTLLMAAVERAMRMMGRIDDTFPKRRAIGLISDGKDEGSGMVLDDLTSGTGELPVPVLAVGYSRIGTGHFDTLRRLAAISGGRFVHSTSSSEIGAQLHGLVDELDDTWSVRLRGDGLVADGRTATLQVQVAQGGGVFPATRVVTLLGGPDAVAPAPEPLPEPDPPEASAAGGRWVFLLGAALGLAGLAATSVVLVALLTAWALHTRRDATAAVVADRGDVSSRHAPLVVSGPMASLPESDPREDVRPPVACVRLGLDVVSGPGALAGDGLVQIDEQGVVLGRDGALRVSGDAEVSARHCQFALHRSFVVVTDLESRNGTSRNGAVVHGRERLELGDELRVGETTLRVQQIEGA